MDQTWRTTPLARGGSALIAVGLAALGVVSAVLTALDFTAAGLLLAILCWAAAAVFVLVPFRAFIRVDKEGVSYRNFFVTQTVPWGDLRACRAGYNGISLLRVDGSAANAFAVQKSNMAQWRHWQTRADEVCEVIELRRRERTA